MLKRIGFALAFAAALSLAFSPVTLAANTKPPAPTKAQAEWVAQQAAQGNIAIISPTQVLELKSSNPKLHAKLIDAYQRGVIPSLTTSERKAVVDMTKGNLSVFRAGFGIPPLEVIFAYGVFGAGSASIGAAGWLVVIIGIFILLDAMFPGFGAAVLQPLLGIVLAPWSALFGFRIAFADQAADVDSRSPTSSKKSKKKDKKSKDRKKSKK